jgi:hypothetical protein
MSVVRFPTTTARPIVEAEREALREACVEAIMLELELQNQFLNQRRRRQAIIRRSSFTIRGKPDKA